MINFSKNLSNIIRGLMNFVATGALFLPCWLIYYYSADVSWADACGSCAIFYIAMMMVDNVWDKSEQSHIPYTPLNELDEQLVDSFVTKKIKEKKNAIPLDKTEKK